VSQRFGGPEETVERSWGSGGAVGNRDLKIRDWEARDLIGEIGDTI